MNDLLSNKGELGSFGICMPRGSCKGYDIDVEVQCNYVVCTLFSMIVNLRRHRIDSPMDLRKTVAYFVCKTIQVNFVPMLLDYA